MTVDWATVAAIAMPIVSAFVGAFATHIFQSRPKLISHLGFISSHSMQPNEDGSPGTIINTHSVVIRNSGRKGAKNVRLGHNFLPNVDVIPDTEYQVRDLPGGGKEILFPTLAPKKEITINYLYFPPDTWRNVNTHIESDEGPAKVVTVLLQQQPKRWLLAVLWVLIILGLIASIYIIVSLGVWFAA